MWDYCLGEAFRQLKGNEGPFVLDRPQDVLHAVLPDEKWTYRPMYKAKVLQPPRPEDVAEAARFWRTPNDRLFFVGLAPPKARPSPTGASAIVGELLSQWAPAPYPYKVHQLCPSQT